MTIGRRTLLTAIAGASLTGQAGCIGDRTQSSDDDGGGNDNPTDDRNADNGENGDENTSDDNETTARRLSLTSVDENLGPLSFDIDLINEEWSDTEMPTLDIAVKNWGG